MTDHLARIGLVFREKYSVTILNYDVTENVLKMTKIGVDPNGTGSRYMSLPIFWLGDTYGHIPSNDSPYQKFATHYCGSRISFAWRCTWTMSQYKAIVLGIEAITVSYTMTADTATKVRDYCWGDIATGVSYVCSLGTMPMLRNQF